MKGRFTKSRPDCFRRAKALARLQPLLSAGGELQIALLNCSKKQIAFLEINFSSVSIYVNLQITHLKFTKRAVYCSPGKSPMARAGKATFPCGKI